MKNAKLSHIAIQNFCHDWWVKKSRQMLTFVLRMFKWYHHIYRYLLYYYFVSLWSMYRFIDLHQRLAVIPLYCVVSYTSSLWIFTAQVMYLCLEE